MAQEIKIGVNAETGGAERSVEKLETAVAGVGKAMDSLGKSVGGAKAVSGLDAVTTAAKKATVGLQQTAAEAEKLRRIQDTLSRRLGEQVSPADARIAMDNFERVRRRSSTVRAFEGFEQWDTGASSIFRNPRQAGAHRRRVMASVMQNTDYSRSRQPIDEPDEDEPGGGGSDWSRGRRRASSIAMGFAKGALAVAGIGSVMGMAGQAADMATEESVGTDTLKRRMGDLGVDFERLREQARGAADGLGITYVEANRLALQYAREAGNLRGSALEGYALKNRLATAEGFSRGYGIDPSEGVQFFGSMSRLGVAGDDQSSRRLAMMIADSVEKGGFSGKADEVLAAISNFAGLTARYTLSTPNVDAYTSAMGSMMGAHPGLDPGGSASLLNQADSSIRGGGAMGDASKNFLFMALKRGHPNASPFEIQALMQGGLFGTSAGVFGANSPLSEWANGDRNSTTNFDLIKSQTARMGGGPEAQAAALAGALGIGIAQAKELLAMSDKSMSASSDLLARAGIDTSKLNVTALPTIARIAGAHSIGDLGGVVKSLKGRLDVSDADKASIDAALGNGDMKGLQNVLTQVASRYSQDPTEGEKTRQSITDLKNALTMAGGPIVGALNSIRDGTLFIAQHFGMVDPSKNPLVGPQDIGGEFVKPLRQNVLDAKAKLARSPSQFDAAFQAASRATGVPVHDLKALGAIESDFNNMSVGKMTKHGQAFGIMQVMPDSGKGVGFSQADLYDPAKNIMAGAKIYARLLAKFHGDRAKADAAYNGSGPDAIQYAANMAALRGSAFGEHYTPLPDGHKDADTVVQHKMHITSDPVPLVLPGGEPVGAVSLNHHVQPTPAGAR